MKVLVTAGPTREYIDPVRFITNLSTGTMGFSIARAARAKGHTVTLISGPTCLQPPVGAKLILTETAAQMKTAVLANLDRCDCVFMTAAICDFKPVGFSARKIKRINRGDKKVKLELKANPDILKAIAKKKKKQKVIGFALETENLIKNATKKLKDKKLDFIVANKAGAKQNPFGAGMTDVTIIGKEGIVKIFKRVSKPQLAVQLLSLTV